MKRLTLLVTAAAMFALVAMPARAQFQAPDVLKQVPEGSAMVLIIPKLSDVNTRLGKFMKDFGDAPDEMLAPVASILDEMGISKGVDMNGSAAIVMPTLQLMGEPRIYAIVPVGDAVSFMTNFESTTPSDKSPGVLRVPIQRAPPGFMKMAGKYAFKDAFLKAKPAILEPVVSIEVTTPGATVGSITGDLSSRRGKVFGTDVLGSGTTVVKAEVPLAEMMEYEPALKSMTKGRGSFTMEFSHYDPLPQRLAEELVSRHAEERA